MNGGSNCRAFNLYDLMTLPYFNFYPKDWLADTGHLTYEQRGVFHDLLCHMWLREEQCSLPDDDLFVAQLLHLTVSKWKQVRAALVGGYSPVLRVVEGQLVSKRLQEEQSKALDKSKVRAKAAEVRWEASRRKGSDDANASQNDANAEMLQEPEKGLVGENSEKTSENSVNSLSETRDFFEEEKGPNRPVSRSEGDANAMQMDMQNLSKPYANGMHPESDTDTDTESDSDVNPKRERASPTPALGARSPSPGVGLNDEVRWRERLRAQMLRPEIRTYAEKVSPGIGPYLEDELEIFFDRNADKVWAEAKWVGEWRVFIRRWKELGGKARYKAGMSNGRHPPNRGPEPPPPQPVAQRTVVYDTKTHQVKEVRRTEGNG